MTHAARQRQPERERETMVRGVAREIYGEADSKVAPEECNAMLKRSKGGKSKRIAWRERGEVRSRANKIIFKAVCSFGNDFMRKLI